MNDSNSSFIKSYTTGTAGNTDADVFLEAQELIDRLSDIICTCPSCMAKLRAKSD
jgi:hypothetical protein